MEYLERDPLPLICQECHEVDCYECDYAMARWYLADEDEAVLIERLQEQRRKRLAKMDRSYLRKGGQT